jgi:hypothetical protein
MLNTYIECTPDGGHDRLMLRNPQTRRGILDQMGLPVPARRGDTQELVRVCIYSSGPVAEFDEARLKRVLSAKLGEKIRASNIRIIRPRSDRGRAASLTTPGSPSCTIRVPIVADAYLSSVSTKPESDSSQDELELEDTAQEIRIRVLRLFHGQVTEDSISVEWTRVGNSYFVLVRLTALAAELLCHLVEADDPVVPELDIAAVLYGSKCLGMDYAMMYPKIKTEPMRTLLARAMISVEEMLVQSASLRDSALVPLPSVGIIEHPSLVDSSLPAVKDAKDPANKTDPPAIDRLMMSTDNTERLKWLLVKSADVHGKASEGYVCLGGLGSSVCVGCASSTVGSDAIGGVMKSTSYPHGAKGYIRGIWAGVQPGRPWRHIGAMKSCSARAVLVGADQEHGTAPRIT